MSENSENPIPLQNEEILAVTRICNNLCYWLHLQLYSKATGVTVEIPVEIEKIVELSKHLPMPEPLQWAQLAKGRVPSKLQPSKKQLKVKVDISGGDAPVNGNVDEQGREGTDKKRKRQTWTEANREELLRLVDDEAHRQETLGKSALNWASIARHLGFSAKQAVQRQYNILKGIELPSAIKRAKTTANGTDDQPSKKVKPDQDAVDGWTKAQQEELVKLVKNEGYRKQVLGKKKLKWQRLADHFSKSKKDIRHTFTKLTGEIAE